MKTESTTPKQDITWYVKWMGSILMLFAISVRASGVTEYAWVDMFCSWLGCLMWWWVGFRWNDRAIQLVNGVAAMTLSGGLLRIFFS